MLLLVLAMLVPPDSERVGIENAHKGATTTTAQNAVTLAISPDTRSWSDRVSHQYYHSITQVLCRHQISINQNLGGTGVFAPGLSDLWWRVGVSISGEQRLGHHPTGRPLVFMATLQVRNHL
jgi:hypothetical protein